MEPRAPGRLALWRHDREQLLPRMELHARLAEQKIVDFGFVGDDLRHQFTVFEDGTRITVQLDSGEYTVQYPEETAAV